MKVFFFSFFIMASAFAQDATSYLKTFDAKIYSLKSKGIKDFVVDIQSSKLTKDLKDQQTFGKIEDVIFRTYWTADPERVAIEIIGLPDGFVEVKEGLKAGMLPVLENLLPLGLVQKFQGYKFTQVKPREIVAQDTSGLAPVPSFTLRFDDQDKLIEIVGNKPVGTLVMKPVYDKPSFAEGKLVLTSETTSTSENGQTVTVTKELDYEKSQGITVLSEVEMTSEHKSAGGDAKVSKATEEFTFKNYKINEGEAMKYFLSESKAVTPVAPVKAPKK